MRPEGLRVLANAANRCRSYVQVLEKIPGDCSPVWIGKYGVPHGTAVRAELI